MARVTIEKATGLIGERVRFWLLGRPDQIGTAIVLRVSAKAVRLGHGSVAPLQVSWSETHSYALEDIDMEPAGI